MVTSVRKTRDQELHELLSGMKEPDPDLLFELAPVLPESLLPRAIEIAWKIQEPGLRAKVLVALAARLKESERTELLRKVLTDMQGDVRDDDLPLAFGWMAPYLPKSLYKAALDKVFNFKFGPMQTAGMVVLAPLLSKSLQQRVVDHACKMQYPDDSIAALMYLEPRLHGPLRQEIKEKLKEKVKKIDDDEVKRRVSAALALKAPLPPSDVSGELAKARTIGSPHEKVKTLLSLARYLSEPLKREVLCEAYKTAQNDMGNETYGYPGIAALAARRDVQMAVSSQAAFYFVLEGKAVRGNLVKAGTDVDLVFNYDIPPPDVIATLKGAKLDEIRKQNINLGITVIPRGFIFRDKGWYQTARFKEAKIEEPVRFLLRAADQVVEESGFYIIFDARGCVMYQFFLEVQLVPKIPAKHRSEPIRKQLDLDLAELISEKERAEEAMRMML